MKSRLRLVSVLLYMILSSGLLTACESSQDTPQSSTPSVTWSELLSVANKKIASVYKDAFLSSVTAVPYDFDVNPGYSPSTDILKVQFSFMRATTSEVDIIKVQLADADPKSTMQLETTVHKDDSDYYSVFKEVYETTSKEYDKLDVALSNIKITPRDAIELTRTEEAEHIQQVGLSRRLSFPEIKFAISSDGKLEWQVVYRLNPIHENGQLELRKPIATFLLDTQSGAIISRQFDDGAPLFSESATQPTMELTAAPKH